MKYTIGCHSIETDSFYNQRADGILGIGPVIPAQSSKTNKLRSGFITELYENKVISKNMFSICLSHNGGYMSIGGVNHTYHLENHTNFVDLEYNQHYAIYIKYIQILQEYINVSYTWRVVIDTGSTYSYFPNQIYTKISSVLDNYCVNITSSKTNTSDTNDITNKSNVTTENKCLFDIYTNENDLKCYTKSNSTDLEYFYNLFPNIYFNLDDGVIFTWRPSDYLMKNNKENKGNYCVGFINMGL